MSSLCGTTTDKSIIKEVEKTLVQYNLKQNLLRCVTTDGGKNMCGAGLLAGQIHQAYENERFLRPMVYSQSSYYASIGSLQKIFKSTICLLLNQ